MSDVGSYTDSMEDIEGIIYSVDLSSSIRTALDDQERSDHSSGEDDEEQVRPV